MRSSGSASRYDRQTAIFIRLPDSPCPGSDTFPRLASIMITRGGASRLSIWTEDGSTNCSLAGSRLPDPRAYHRLVANNLLAFRLGATSSEGDGDNEVNTK
jgi:hypothetical protein